MPPSSDRTRTKTILLVEDSAAVRKMVGEALRTMGFAVLQATDGPEALELSSQHPGEISLLLTDVFLPSMNGRELSRRITARWPETAVLLMSGDALSTLGMLQWPCLQKPFSLGALKSKIEELVGPAIPQPAAARTASPPNG